jgi:uncharacterized protein YqgC (DUF456 family)
MQFQPLLDQVPLWVFYLVTAIIVVLSTLTGFRLGSYVRRHNKGASEAPVGTIAGAMLGLLAFILAFSYGMAASRFDARKTLLLDEVNGIGTAFLRADFLPDHQRAETRKLLKKYVDLRSDYSRHPEKLPQLLVDSEALHDQLWAQVTSLPKNNEQPVLVGLYIQALNEIIDLHSKRVTVGLLYRISPTIWLTLFFVSMLTMLAVGYHFGITGAGSFWITLVLTLSFSAIILLIADLDRPRGGLINVSQEPMVELQQKLRSSTE